MDLSNYRPEWVAIGGINIENTGFRFRKDITLQSVTELAKSMASEGQKFPVVLWRRHSGEVQLISGFRRVTAARELGWEKVLAVVIGESELSEEEALRLNFIENIERKTLTNLDIMFACRKLKEQGKTNEEIGKLIGKNERTVRRYIGITELSPEDQAKVERGDTSIRNVSSPEIGTRADSNLKNKNNYVKSSKKMFEAWLKIEPKPENTAILEEHIREVKRVWKKALKAGVRRQNSGVRIKAENIKPANQWESVAGGDMAEIPEEVLAGLPLEVQEQMKRFKENLVKISPEQENKGQ